MRSRRLGGLGTSVLLALLTLCGRGTAPAHADDRSGWVWPLAGRPAVVRGFQPPAVRWSAGHRGVDLRAGAGAIVRAAGPGIVSFAGSLAGRGVVVVAHDDGTRTTYEPVLTTAALGARVTAGDPIGRLTVGGGHCLPETCLHWGRLRGSTYLDPLALVAAGPARLLPVWGSGAPARPGAPAHPGPGPPRATAQAAARPGVGTTAPQDASGAAGWGALTANGPTLLPLVLLGLAMLPLAADRPRPRRRRQRHRGRERGQSRAGSSTASRR